MIQQDEASNITFKLSDDESIDFFPKLPRTHFFGDIGESDNNNRDNGKYSNALNQSTISSITSPLLIYDQSHQFEGDDNNIIIREDSPNLYDDMEFSKKTEIRSKNKKRAVLKGLNTKLKSPPVNSNIRHDNNINNIDDSKKNRIFHLTLLTDDDLSSENVSNISNCEYEQFRYFDVNQPLNMDSEHWQSKLSDLSKQSDKISTLLKKYLFSTNINTIELVIWLMKLNNYISKQSIYLQNLNQHKQANYLKYLLIALDHQLSVDLVSFESEESDSLFELFHLSLSQRSPYSNNSNENIQVCYNAKFLIHSLNDLMRDTEDTLMELEIQIDEFVQQSNNFHGMESFDHVIVNISHYHNFQESLDMKSKLCHKLDIIEDLYRQFIHILNPSDKIDDDSVLTSLIASKDSVDLLCEVLYNIPIANNKYSLAVMLLRSQCTPLILSVYSSWPSLNIKIPVSNKSIIYKSTSPNKIKGTRTIESISPSKSTKSTKSKSATDCDNINTVTSMSFHTIAHISPSKRIRNKLLPIEDINIVEEDKTQLVSVSSKDLDLSIVQLKEPSTLRMIGFTTLQLLDSGYYSVNDLLIAGFPMDDIRDLRMKNLFTLRDVKVAGYSVAQCHYLGYSLDEIIRDGGYDFYEIVCSNIYNEDQIQRISPDIQRYCLMALYNSTNGLDWRNNENWGTSLPLKMWFGVIVNDDGIIVKIDLKKNYLKGKLPACLSLLTSLRSLNFFENKLYGTIPNDWNNLINLKELYIPLNNIESTNLQIQAILPYCKIIL